MTNAIVTLRFEKYLPDVDVELPTNVPFKLLRELVRETLLQLMPQAQYLKNIEFYARDQRLEEQTLAECGLWDGSILNVREAKE